MVYDCFQFFNELDILKIRLNVLAPVVDRFVISEATETFSGIKKPLYYEENKELFAAFQDRINTVCPAVTVIVLTHKLLITVPRRALVQIARIISITEDTSRRRGAARIYAVRSGLRLLLYICHTDIL